MTIEFFMGQDFETSHERQSAKKILELMDARYGNFSELLLICMNHYLNGKQIDCTILKRDAIIVIELKEWEKPFHATENGPWLSITDKSILGSSEQNPFEQVSKYRRLWIDYLKKNQNKFLSDNKAKSMDFTHISAYVVISPGLNEKTINELPGNIKPWFQLIGLNELPEKVDSQTSKGLNFNDNELRKLVKEVLNLRPGNKSTGRSNSEPTSSQQNLLPPLPSMLIGREQEMYDLKLRLGVKLMNGQHSHATTQIFTVMRGWPGVGKTTLAATAAHDPDVEREFTDGILWTSLGQKVDIFSELVKWARAIGITDFNNVSTPNELRDQIINKLKNKRVLLIVDDVWNSSDAMFFRVGSQNSSTLITTRIPVVADELAPTETDIYCLPVLSNKASMDLLEKIAPTVVLKYMKECNALATELEGLPLALQVAGKMLNTQCRRGGNVKELIDNILLDGDLIKNKAPADRSDLVNQTTPTIAALLEMSINILDIETRERFAFLGAFAPKPATFDTEDVKSIWEIAHPESTINTLLDQGLIENVNDRYQMHALLVMLAKSLLS